MAIYHDQLKRAISIPAIPKKIISVVPSQTELLFGLGLNVEVIGVTKFCIHPAEQTKHITKIGGTKQLNIELIKELKPDLVIANKEENDQSQIVELAKHYPVWISDINNLPAAINMIQQVGILVNRITEAKYLCQNITQQFSKLNITPLNRTVAYLIWRNPYMAAGTDTFINSMLQLCGLNNTFDMARYPEIATNMLIEANPDIVFLSSEPYPFKQKHIYELKEVLPAAKIILVDGELFSWYGSRLLYAPAYFKRLINNIHFDIQ